MKNDFCEEYEKSFPKAVKCLEEGFEDSVQFYAFEELDSRKISSTNTLERLNREIRRRSSVVGIFPSTDSYIRLITSYLLEYSEDWQTERCYINASSIKVQKEILFNAAWWIFGFFQKRNCELKIDTIRFYDRVTQSCGVLRDMLIVFFSIEYNQVLNTPTKIIPFIYITIIIYLARALLSVPFVIFYQNSFHKSLNHSFQAYIVLLVIEFAFFQLPKLNLSHYSLQLLYHTLLSL